MYKISLMVNVMCFIFYLNKKLNIHIHTHTMYYIFKESDTVTGI